ncbi:MAG TPA: hypothetical protein VIO14_10765 [Dehalococcoidia bacterium]
MLRLKGCPRCRGDLFLDRDPLDAAWRCLQCGHQVPDPRLLRRPARRAA